MKSSYETTSALIDYKREKTDREFDVLKSLTKNNSICEVHGKEECI